MQGIVFRDSIEHVNASIMQQGRLRDRPLRRMRADSATFERFVGNLLYGFEAVAFSAFVFVERHDSWVPYKRCPHNETVYLSSGTCLPSRHVNLSIKARRKTGRSFAFTGMIIAAKERRNARKHFLYHRSGCRSSVYSRLPRIALNHSL